MIASALAAMVMTVIEPAAAQQMSALAGAYRHSLASAQIIPVDERHAYVHLYLVVGRDHDTMAEFEEIMTLDGDALRFSKTADADGDGVGCDLTLRRQAGAIVWQATAAMPCSSYAPPGYEGIFIGGTMPVAGRRPARGRHRYPGEGIGYAAIVRAWRTAETGQR